MLRISAQGTVHVLVPVTGKVAGRLVDITQDPVRMAVIAPNSTPADSDWHLADWEVDAASGAAYARLLVGPDGGAVAPAKGRWHAWVKVADFPETAVIDGGPLEIY